MTRLRSIPFVRRVAGAVIAALVVTAIAWFGSVLAFFVAASGQTAALVQLIPYFFGAALATFIIITLFGVVGLYVRWYLRLIGGLVGVVLGAIIGTSVGVAASGTTLTGSIFSQIFAELIGPLLPFVLLGLFAVMNPGCLVWHRFVGASGVAAERRVAFVRPPAGNLADGELTHIGRTAIDVDLANRQWDAYVAALVENGWEINEVPIASGMADSVFIEDAVVLFGSTAIITSPGAESRRGEIEAVERAVRDARLTVARIQLPGTLDGGDVLKVGTTVYVGRGGRTNAEGIRQLRGLVAPLGYTVVAVPMTKALHLKSAVTALPDGTIIGYLPVVDDPFMFDRFLAMPEEGGAHVVVLSADTVLMAASAPLSKALIESLGYRVITVDVSEFEKLEGCVTCLSVRLR